MAGRLFVCGDTHGKEAHTLKLSEQHFLVQKDLTKKDVVFQLGDFGWLWFALGEVLHQEAGLDWLASRNFTLAVVPGNHENYDILNTLPEEQKWGNTVRVLKRKVGSIYFLKRGAVYIVNGKKILTIGGAISPDKGRRITNVTWWPEESLSYSETDNCIGEILNHGNEFDYVLTHTCPTRFLNSFFKKKNISIQCSVSDFLDHVYGMITFKGWHFGHLHTDRSLVDGTLFCHYLCPPYELTDGAL